MEGTVSFDHVNRRDIGSVFIGKENTMKSILDRSFKYTPSAETDLRKTFAKLRRQQRSAQKTALNAHSRSNVRLMKNGGASK
jgi:hypothetical protein